MTMTIHADDTLVILATVTDSDGAVKDLTSATVTAIASKVEPRKSSATTVSPTVSVTSPTLGKFTMTFAADSLTTGMWSVQARAAIGSESQVVVDESILVNRSII